LAVYEIGTPMFFPPVDSSEEDGLLAFGGDLSTDRLILAYKNGIFPWFSNGYPILWWSPDPRFILFPDKLKISSSMKKFMKKTSYTVTFDTSFKEVITSCAKMREVSGTWITKEMQEAYCNLHSLNLAHSVEVWENDKLIGGLYGVSIGRCFFGESMFSKKINGSKFGFITLVEFLKQKGFIIIDCQVHTNYLESLGAEHISRKEFLKIIKKGFKSETMKYKWELS
jgi:leucyl/phenylalanyl-tRNA---protein transferase